MFDLRHNYPVLPEQETWLWQQLPHLWPASSPSPLRLLPVELTQADRVGLAAAWSQANWPVQPNQVFAASSGHNALSAIFHTVLPPGARLAVDPVTYSNLMGLAKLHRVELVAVPGDEDGMLPDALDATHRRQAIHAVYVMPTLHNPLTTVMPLNRRAALVEVATRHNLWLLDDDAYGFLVDDAPPSLAHLAPERTFYFQSMTKVLLPGVKLAVLLAPAQMRDSLHNALRLTAHGPSRLWLDLVLWLHENGHWQRWLAEKRIEATRRQGIARSILGKRFPKYTHPNSYHAWLQLPVGTDAAAWVAKLDAAGVGVVPGVAFTPPQLAPVTGIRVALGGENEDARLRQALTILAEHLGS